MGTPLVDFLIAIIAFEVGLLLFYLHRKPKFTKFVESMTILLLIMAPTASTFPLLAEYKGYIYFFLPIYLMAINGWLLFTKKYIIGNDDWHEKTNVNRVIRGLWVFLMIIFFFGSIIMVIIVPYIPKL